jgi:hypothetical protein
LLFLHVFWKLNIVVVLFVSLSEIGPVQMRANVFGSGTHKELNSFLEAAVLVVGGGGGIP